VKKAAQAAFFIACGMLALFLPNRHCELSEAIQGFVWCAEGVGWMGCFLRPKDCSRGLPGGKLLSLLRQRK
jgi:hypothetical protein